MINVRAYVETLQIPGARGSEDGGRAWCGFPVWFEKLADPDPPVNRGCSISATYRINSIAVP